MIGHDVALALVGLGTALIVAACLGALAPGQDELTRLHLLAPVTSLGAPLVGAGLCVQSGWGLSAAEIVLTVVLLAVSGPIVGAATGRLIAQHDGLVEPESPQ